MWINYVTRFFLLLVGVRSYWYESEFKAIGKTDVHYVNSEDLAVKVLANDRADVYVSDQLTGIFLGKKILGGLFDEIGFSQLAKDPSKGFLIYPKNGSEELRNKLDSALKSMHEDGTFQKLMQL